MIAGTSGEWFESIREQVTNQGRDGLQVLDSSDLDPRDVNFILVVQISEDEYDGTSEVSGPVFYFDSSDVTAAIEFLEDLEPTISVGPECAPELLERMVENYSNVEA